MHSLLRCLRFCLVTTVCAGAIIWTYLHVAPIAQAQSEHTAQRSTQIDEAALSNQVQALLAQNSDLDMSVSIGDLQTNKTYHWGDSAGYTAASLGKIITAAAYLHLTESGQASLDDTIDGVTSREQLTKLIKESDNDAWMALNQAITLDGLQQYAKTLGLANYDPQENSMTSDQITQVCAKLYKGALLGAADTSLLLSLMKNANMRDYIVAAIPSGTTVYHKVGYLDDRLNETAIITRDNHSYVLTIFTKAPDSYDFSRGTDLFTSLTRSSLKAFFP